MLSAVVASAPRLCGCPACKFVARRAEDTLLAALTFDLSYEILRRTDVIRLEFRNDEFGSVTFF